VSPGELDRDGLLLPWTGFGDVITRGWTAFDVAKIVAELIFLEQLIDVRTFAGPCDAAQKNRAVGGG
jgi:hypothetical protein